MSFGRAKLKRFNEDFRSLSRSLTRKKSEEDQINLLKARIKTLSMEKSQLEIVNTKLVKENSSLTRENSEFSRKIEDGNDVKKWDSCLIRFKALKNRDQPQSSSLIRENSDLKRKFEAQINENKLQESRIQTISTEKLQLHVENIDILKKSRSLTRENCDLRREYEAQINVIKLLESRIQTTSTEKSQLLAKLGIYEAELNAKNERDDLVVSLRTQLEEKVSRENELENKILEMTQRKKNVNNGIVAENGGILKADCAIERSVRQPSKLLNLGEPTRDFKDYWRTWSGHYIIYMIFLLLLLFILYHIKASSMLSGKDGGYMASFSTYSSLI